MGKGYVKIIVNISVERLTYMMAFNDTWKGIILKHGAD